jgi:hypothetical protein
MWEQGSLVTQYELSVLHGDFLRPVSSSSSLSLDDRTRFLRLASAVRDTDQTLIRHRLDRLHVTLTPRWGAVRIGRQAVTWGSGFVFNPGDLINPFAPTEIEREYKVGEDMVWVQGERGRVGWEVLGAVRRDREGKVRASSSALGARLRCGPASGFAVRNFEDSVFGLAGIREIGEGVARMDLVWTDPDHAPGYLSAVVNLDRSAVVARRNVYGFLELHWSGVGQEDAGRARHDCDLVARIERGTLFTLGRLYGAANLEVEVHPLLNTGITVILNIEDGSTVVQPELRWDFAPDMDFRFGLDISFGAGESEFARYPDAVQCRVGWYF